MKTLCIFFAQNVGKIIEKVLAGLKRTFCVLIGKPVYPSKGFLQAIVQEHSGRMSLESVVGRGTTVRVAIPVEKRSGQRRGPR